MKLLHAFPLDGSMWDGVLDGEPADYPGSGSLAGWADRAAAAIRGREVVVGISMGGFAALELARRHPEKLAALVLADTRAEADSDEARTGRERAIETLRGAGAAALFESMRPRLFRAEPDPGVVDAARRIAERQPVDRLIAMSEAARDRRDSRDVLPAIAVPVLVLGGAEDAITPPRALEALAAAIPSARTAILPGAGHLSPLEQPAAFAAACCDFVGSVSP